MHFNVKDLTGKRFGKLVVKNYAYSKTRIAHWLCVCDCGNEKILMGHNLGKTKSCGCHRSEVSKKFLTNVKPSLKHGRSGSREYGVWSHMRGRCNDPNVERYKNYGGRGITYDPKWETFGGFWEDMQEGYADNLSIDRIDNNKGYSKDNCKWSTQEEQLNNMTTNKLYEWEGIVLNIAQWAKLKGFNRNVLAMRLYRGWTFERAITKSLKRKAL